MNSPSVLIFGGSSGIGEATARAALESGCRTAIAGRNLERLERAAARLGSVETYTADALDAAAVTSVFERAAPVDHVVICVSGGKGAGAFRELDLADLREALESKTLAQLNVAQVASRQMEAGGSITFVGAASTRSVIRGTAGLCAVNAAIEAVVPILALELAPTRVNAVSPGIIDTEWWSGMPEEAKRAFFANAERSLPVQRVGRAEEAAHAILFLIQNGFVTGSVYEVDGGSHLITQ